MSYRPSVIVLDYETALTTGEPSVEYYRDDFRVVSAALAWRGSEGAVKTKYLEGETAIQAYLLKVRAEGIPVVVHNFQFEYGCTAYRSPGLESIISFDTMRLAQVADNGGSKYHGTVKLQTYDDLLDAAEGGGDAAEYRAGLGLVACASRWLPEEYKEHKEPFHTWLRENAGVKKGHEGRNLDKLPRDMFEAYNVADAEATLVLYETLTQYCLEQGYNWNLDHELYKSTARMVSIAKGVGLPVQRQSLEEYIAEIEAEIAGIEAEFRCKFIEPILALERSWAEDWVNELKTEKGRANRRDQTATLEPLNVGSNKQLDALFRGMLGITPQFWTRAPKTKPGKERKKEFVPSPSFKAAHLSTYGEGGLLLKTRRARLLVMTQAKALCGLSRYDGKWHFDIRVAGTATSRMAGGRA